VYDVLSSDLFALGMVGLEMAKLLKTSRYYNLSEKIELNRDCIRLDIESLVFHYSDNFNRLLEKLLLGNET